MASSFPAFNQITTQLAKLHQRLGGAQQFPVTIRIPYGGGIGAVEHHSESPEVYFMHTPGLRVVTPASVQDAFTMTYLAIASPDPVIVFEPKARYWDKAEIDVTLPDTSEAGLLELHKARVVRPGTDITLVAYGPTVRTALSAAQVLAEEGKEVEVIDLRSLSRWICRRWWPLPARRGAWWWFTRRPRSAARALRSRPQ